MSPPRPQICNYIFMTCNQYLFEETEEFVITTNSFPFAFETSRGKYTFYFSKALIHKKLTKFYSSLEGISYLASNGNSQKINEFVSSTCTNDMQNTL